MNGGSDEGASNVPSTPDRDDDAADTDPMKALNQWGGSWAAVPEPAVPDFGQPAPERFGTPGRPTRETGPVLGDVELPPAPATFDFPPPEPSAGRRGLIIGAAGLAALVVGGLGFWFLSRPSGTESAAPDQQTTTVTSPAASTTDAPRRDPAAEAQLLRTLPAGYPPGACRPVAPEAGGTVAAVDCAKNLDPGGPTAASFMVAADRDALDAALTAAIRPADIVVCPGNIQSPGPWRRNAKPDEVAGTLVCGMAGNVPTVAWSDFDRQVVSVVRADPPGPGLDQLYQWWASHS